MCIRDSGYSMFYYFAVLYAVRYASVVSFSEWGIIMALSSASYLAAVPLTEFAARFRPAPFYTALVLLQALAPLMFLSGTTILIFASMALLNVGGALAYAVERTFVAQATDPTMRGKAESFMNVSFYIGAAIGSSTGGYLYSTHPPLLLLMASIMLAAGAALGFMLFRKMPNLYVESPLES